MFLFLCQRCLLRFFSAPVLVQAEDVVNICDDNLQLLFILAQAVDFLFLFLPQRGQSFSAFKSFMDGIVPSVSSLK